MTRTEKLLCRIGVILIWLVMLAPVLLLLTALVEAWLDFRFLHIMPLWQGVAMALIPTMALGTMLIVKRFTHIHSGVQAFLTVLCALYMLPLGLIYCMFCLEFYSKTEDMAHYMQVDELYHMGTLEEELFPDQPHPEGKYLYCCDYNNNAILFAEWTLAPDELAAEFARAEALLSAEERYLDMQHGDYRCLIAADLTSPPCTPFEIRDGTTYHSMVMFACNAETGIVRYLSNDTDANRGEIPWYMTLDWGTE